MRREDKEITYPPYIEAIIARAFVCRLAVSDDGQPYVVPLCYGYKDNTLYLHSAREGRKLDILRKNDRVCIEIDIDCEIVQSDDPCSWSVKYRSVIGFGRASFIVDEEEKMTALNIITAHYGGDSHAYDVGNVRKTAVIKVALEDMTAKQSGY